MLNIHYPQQKIQDGEQHSSNQSFTKWMNLKALYQVLEFASLLVQYFAIRGGQTTSSK